MYGAGVQWIVAIGHAQETGALLKRLVAQARHFQQRLAVGKRTVAVAVLHHVFGDAGAQSGDAGQQRRRCRVDVDADGIHAILDARIQRVRELDLVHVVLVLADADRLGLDLHQFRQRVLQSAGNGDGAAQRDIQLREFLRSQFGCGVNRRAGFADHHLAQVEIRVLLHQLRSELVSFARCRAVADRQQIHAVLPTQPGQLRDRFVPLLARFVWINDVGGQQLAGGVDHGHFHSGANTRVQAHHRSGACRRGKQQVLQVVAKYADGFVFSALARPAEQIQRELQVQFGAPGHAHRVTQPGVGSAAPVVNVGVGGYAAFGFGMALFGVDRGTQLQFQYALVARTQQGEQTMRGDLAEGFHVIEVIAEFRASGFLAADHPGANLPLGPHPLAQLADQRGVLGNAFHQDGTCAVECGADVSDALVRVDKRRGGHFGCLRGILAQAQRQWFQAGFTGYLRPGAALGFVRQVQVLQPGFGFGCQQVGLQRVRQLALFLDAAQDRCASIFQFAQIMQALFQRA